MKGDMKEQINELELRLISLAINEKCVLREFCFIIDNMEKILSFSTSLQILVERNEIRHELQTNVIYLFVCATGKIAL